jgi:hypothetical protein
MKLSNGVKLATFSLQVHHRRGVFFGYFPVHRAARRPQTIPLTEEITCPLR